MDVAKLKKSNYPKKSGSGWVGPGPIWMENWKKNPQNIKIFDDYLFLGDTVKVMSQNCTLHVAKVVIVCCPSRRLFKKKKWIRGWVGGVSSIQIFWDVWNLFNFARPLSCWFICWDHMLPWKEQHDQLIYLKRKQLFMLPNHGSFITFKTNHYIIFFIQPLTTF